MRKPLLNLVFLTAVYTVIFPPKAHAYLDPGTGSYIIQVVAATLFAGLFLVKTWWNEISKAFLRIKRIVTDIFGRKDKKLVEKKSDKE